MRRSVERIYPLLEFSGDGVTPQPPYKGYRVYTSLLDFVPRSKSPKPPWKGGL